MALDGGLIKEADGCPQWFLSLRSVASAPRAQNLEYAPPFK